jgi:putative ABC transport system permease protein
MTSLWLAWRTTRRYRVRAALAVTGVAVIGALLFDMLLLSRGLLDSFADLLRAAASTYARRRRRDPLRAIADRRVGEARRRPAPLPEIGQVAHSHRGRARSTTSRRPARDRHVGDQRQRRTIAEASTSRSRCRRRIVPIVISAAGAELDAGPGSKMRISVRPGVRSALRTDCRDGRGVFGRTINEYAVATAMTTLQAALDSRQSPDADLVLVASRPETGAAAAVRAIERIRPDLRAYSNDDVVAQFNQNGFAYFRQISVVLSSLTMVFAFLLVATLLTVSVNQRLGEIARCARSASAAPGSPRYCSGNRRCSSAAARCWRCRSAASSRWRSIACSARCRDCPNGCTFSCSSGARSRSTSRSSR